MLDPLVVALLSVALAAILGALGWSVRDTLLGIRGQVAAIGLQQTAQLEALGEHSKALAVVVTEARPVLERLAVQESKMDAVERQVASLREATSVLARELELHQDWHRGQPRGGGRRGD